MRNALVHRQAPRVGLDAAKVDHVIEKKKKKTQVSPAVTEDKWAVNKNALTQCCLCVFSTWCKKRKKEKERPVVHKWCYFCSPQGCKYSIIKETSKKRKYHCGHVGCMSPLTTPTNRVDKW